MEFKSTFIRLKFSITQIGGVNYFQNSLTYSVENWAIERDSQTLAFESRLWLRTCISTNFNDQEVKQKLRLKVK